MKNKNKTKWVVVDKNYHIIVVVDTKEQAQLARNVAIEIARFNYDLDCVGYTKYVEEENNNEL